MGAKSLSLLKKSTTLKASQMTPEQRYRMALNYAVQCFSMRGQMTKITDELVTEIKDLLSGQAEWVNGQIVYHQDMDLSKKTYVVDNWL